MRQIGRDQGSLETHAPPQHESIGVINPISVDEDMTLIAGAHRLEAAKNLGWETIEAKVFNEEDLQGN